MLFMVTPQRDRAPLHLSLRRRFQSVLCGEAGSGRVSSDVLKHENILIRAVLVFASLSTTAAFWSHVKGVQPIFIIQNLHS